MSRSIDNIPSTLFFSDAGRLAEAEEYASLGHQIPEHQHRVDGVPNRSLSLRSRLALVPALFLSDADRLAEAEECAPLEDQIPEHQYRADGVDHRNFSLRNRLAPRLGSGLDH